MKFEDFEICQVKDLKVGDQCILQLFQRNTNTVSNCCVGGCGCDKELIEINRRLQQYQDKDIQPNELETIDKIVDGQVGIHYMPIIERVFGRQTLLNEKSMWSSVNGVLRLKKE